MTGTYVAIAGFGGRGHAHLRTLRAIGVEDVAVVDHHEERRAHALASGATTTAAQLDDLLRCGAPRIVVVATPASDHVETTLRASAAGAGVVVEKPVCIDEEGAELLGQLGSGSFVCAAHAERWNPAVLALCDELGGDGIGVVERARFRRTGPSGPAGTTLGCGLDLAVHDLDLVEMLFGSLVVSSRRQEPADGPPARVGFTGRAGAVAVDVEAAWARRRQRTIEIHGSGEPLTADLVAGRAWRHTPGAAPSELPVSARPPLEAMWAAVLAAVESGDAPPVPLAAGLRAVALALPARTYDRSGAGS